MYGGHRVESGIVQPLSEGVYGFNSGRPIALFGYEGRAEAEAAATHAQEVVKDAVSARAGK
jgi:GTPase